MDIESAAVLLKSYDGPRISVMEVCGTHTAAIFNTGVRSLLSPKIRLISGPGCPVCVTPTTFIDRCIEIAKTENRVVMSFGDMLKVPGSRVSLAGARSEGGRVEMMYSPFEAVARAKRDPGTTFVLAAVGFETTVPAYALAIEEAAALGLENIRLVTALKSVLPALKWVSENGEADGFICPGHVSVITGADAYTQLAEKYDKPFVVAGFEGEHIVAAICAIIQALSGKRGVVRNLYPSAVSGEGNLKAQAVIDKYFERGSAFWRGLDAIPDSGFYLREEYARFDGGGRELGDDGAMPSGCLCGDVIAGRADPSECLAFGGACLPENPLGPCMVSAEGACGIWYRGAGSEGW
ncbi:MAG: hydrogenase formation protein HypD [Clostridiales Family XIII bacterium]|jgi:hydrogenase expression/formation protein HypD|nr:hydrogenase formation protein HypD [Clostridiales Family XIII bacterium]